MRYWKVPVCTGYHRKDGLMVSRNDFGAVAGLYTYCIFVDRLGWNMLVGIANWRWFAGITGVYD